MGKFLLLLIMGTASVSMACPNLTGTFKCNGNIFEVSQSETSDGVLYSINENGKGFKVLANGQEYERITEMFKGTVSYSCQNQALVIQEKGDLYEDVTRVGSLSSRYKLYLDENLDLVSEGLSEVMYWEEKYHISLNFKCLRL